MYTTGVIKVSIRKKANHDYGSTRNTGSLKNGNPNRCAKHHTNCREHSRLSFTFCLMPLGLLLLRNFCTSFAHRYSDFDFSKQMHGLRSLLSILIGGTCIFGIFPVLSFVPFIRGLAAWLHLIRPSGHFFQELRHSVELFFIVCDSVSTCPNSCSKPNTNLQETSQKQ